MDNKPIALGICDICNEEMYSTESLIEEGVGIHKDYARHESCSQPLYNKKGEEGAKEFITSKEIPLKDNGEPDWSLQLVVNLCEEYASELIKELKQEIVELKSDKELLLAAHADKMETKTEYWQERDDEFDKMRTDLQNANEENARLREGLKNLKDEINIGRSKNDLKTIINQLLNPNKQG